MNKVDFILFLREYVFQKIILLVEVGIKTKSNQTNNETEKMQANDQRSWWRSIDPSTVDPITLEPIRDFAIEPFHLDKTLFDGEMLAH